MFDSLQKRLASGLAKVRGLSRITEKEVDLVLAEIRTGLLEADVHFRVTRDFLARVKERCLREDVIKSLSPEQQILKVLSEELTFILGGKSRDLNLAVKPPAVILMCGLQGSGKTTSTSKLGLLLKSQGKRPLLASIDIYRPAAMAQLAQLAKSKDLPCYASAPGSSALDIARGALDFALQTNADVLLIDSAGRLQIDDELMTELAAVRDLLQPTETLLVIDSMMGQQAVEVAEGFDQKIGLTGSILTKLDGDTRGGAALSLVSVTGKPIKFIGTGERPTDFEVFHPERISSRLLDMGDVLSLLEKAKSVISDDEAVKAAEKLKNLNDFSLEDFRDQLQMLSRMGPISGLMKMLPGFGSIKDQLDNVDAEGELKKVNSMLDSMTKMERKQPEILNGSRRSRIAKGAGRDVAEVNQLVKRFLEARKMMKSMGKMGKLFKGGGGAMPGGMGMPGGGGGGAFKGRGGKGFGRKF